MLGKALATLFGILLLAFLVCLGKFYEYNDLHSILVVQSLGGKVSVYTDPGYQWQGWGRVTHYSKSNILDFNKANKANPIKVRFADGGHGDVNGSCRFDLPLDYNKMRDIHQTFGSQEAVENQLVRPNVEKSMYMTGPLMTSAESFNVRRPDLINLFEDQAAHGVFQMSQTSREVDDPVTGTKKWITAVNPKTDKTGSPLRQEESPLIRFGVKLYNVSIVGIDYEKIVEDQIAQQQQAQIAVTIAIANSKKAEQDALTTEQQGKAAAIKAKWDQEVLKAAAVTHATQEKEVAETQANQRLNVAKLDREAADQEKLRQIALGEGESTRRKLILAADNALTARLDTYLKVQAAWASAIGSYRGNITPTFVTGGSAGGTGANALIDLLTAKTAKDLSLDLSFNPQAKQ